MLRKTLTIFSLVGLLISVGLWGVSYFQLIHTSAYRQMRVHFGGFTWIHFRQPIELDSHSRIFGWTIAGFFDLRTIWRIAGRS